MEKQNSRRSQRGKKKRPRGLDRPALIEYLLAKATPRGSCLISSSDNNRYAQVRYGDRNLRVSRLIVSEREGRDLKPDEFVLHSCDTPGCINPDHLRLGTHAENMADMKAAGNTDRAKGEACGRSILSEVQVREIRSRLAGGHSQRALAKRFGISTQTVADILHRRTWKHI